MVSKGSRILIVGGGIAGLEAAITLREIAGGRVELELCSPREDFVYRPYAVAEPYGASRVHRYDLRELAASIGLRFHLDSIVSVDDSQRRAQTHDGSVLSYDHLILACGSRLVAGVPGAVTFWGVADDRRVLDLVRDLRERRVRRLAFTAPGGSSWVLPLYELALLATTELARGGIDDASVVVVTPEERPLHLFGRSAADRVAELLGERGIEVIAGAHPVAYDDGRLQIAPGAPVDADAVLSLPRIEGRRIAGVPHDPDGYVAVDDHGRVLGMSHASAAGDVTSFPVKHGGIAVQQADVVAESIAAQLGCDVAANPFDPVLRGVLWTGGDPLYLSGHLAGGHGETSSATPSPPWAGNGQAKVVGGRLTPFLDHLHSAAA
jgi:sulfide:quinone oxidoreductase